MAYFAEIDSNNIVQRVVVVKDSEILNSDNEVDESLGKSFCTQLFGGNWMQTWKDGGSRNKFAGVGMEYDSANDVFRDTQPYASWSFNSSTMSWEAPVAYPGDVEVPRPAEENPDNKLSSTKLITYTWNENTLSWDEQS